MATERSAPIYSRPRDMGSLDTLMNVFGPWLPWLFGVGSIQLVGGLVAKEMVPNSSEEPKAENA